MGLLNWMRGRTERREKSRADLLAAAEMAADLLMGLFQGFRPTFFDALVGDNKSAQTKEVTAHGSAEMMAFALHLTDRIALARLGNEKRGAFMDAFFPAVQSRVDATLATALPSLYNTRLLFYQSCKMPSGEPNANLKGTLFWEFGKLMASPCHYPDPVYANWNPVAMVQVGLWGMRLMTAIANAFDAANVFEASKRPT
jgi:hypothetical protein